jgi:hypothetical protein
VTLLEETLRHCWGLDGLENLENDIIYAISLCQYELEDYHKAEYTMRLTIDINEKRFGKFGPFQLWLKERLQGWLREWGRDAEAEALQGEIDEILGLDDIELEGINT